MFVSNFVADRPEAGAALRRSGCRYDNHDPVCRMAITLQEGIERRILVESSEAIEDAIFTAAEVLVENLRGATDRMTRKFDVLLQGLLANFDGKLDIHDVRYAVPGNEDVTPVKSSVFPIAIVAELLTVWKIRIDTSRVPTWQAYVVRYGSALLS